MFSLNASFTVVPVRSMAKVSEGFNWEIVAEGGGSRRSLLYFEHRREAESVCRDLNKAA